MDTLLNPDEIKQAQKLFFSKENDKSHPSIHFNNAGIQCQPLKKNFVFH